MAYLGDWKDLYAADALGEGIRQEQAEGISQLPVPQGHLPLQQFFFFFLKYSWFTMFISLKCIEK